MIESKIKDRTEVYQTIIPQIRALIESESDLIANLANVSAVLKQTFNFHWVGWYMVNWSELVLGPFQGPVACTRIQKGQGVCGTSLKEGKTIVVDNVEEFPGHIACSEFSRSEIVVPAKNQFGQVFLILDVDSDKIADFSEIDQKNLEAVVKIIEAKHG